MTSIHHTATHTVGHLVGVGVEYDILLTVDSVPEGTSVTYGVWIDLMVGDGGRRLLSTHPTFRAALDAVASDVEKDLV